MLVPLSLKKKMIPLFVCGCAFLPVAHAEGPMRTDDAGTLDQGGMKLESVFSRDDKVRAGEWLFGFSPIEHLELEVTAAGERDHAPGSDERRHGVGFGAKWVPYQHDAGWSFGARFDYGRTRVKDGEDSSRYTEREYALTGLASYRMGNAHTLHLNLGAARVKAQGESESLAVWGVGYEFPLAERLQLTLETYGEEHARPDKALGLRYEIADALKLSAALGRGNGRAFHQVGLAWEF